MVGVLGAADAVAHFALFWMFVWRVISGSATEKLFAVVWAVLAFAGLLLGVVGRALVKYGRIGKAKRWGIWAIGASTALAGLLLVVAA